MAILNNNPLVGASGNQGGYNINNSLRFRASASAFLNRTFASAGSRTTFTISVWIKRGTLSTEQAIITQGSGNRDIIRINPDNTLFFYWFDATYYAVSTTQVFRDPSAWYHIVVAIDTTQATSSNRVKLYVNGSQITALANTTYPSQNFNFTYWGTTNPIAIGKDIVANNAHLDGYMAEFNFIDGSAKTPSDFGATDATTGVWQPAKYTGTYGTNGFYLKFSDIATTSGSNAGLGKDFSGNSNYWTTNNISVTAGTTYDAMTDSPTLTSATVANYCVLNPLNITTSSANTEANLKFTNNAGAAWKATSGTFAVTSGKYYWEVVFASTTSGYAMTGVLNPNNYFISGKTEANYWSSSSSYSYYGNSGNVFTGDVGSSYGNTYTNGDIIGVALDMDNGKIYFSKNGTWQNSGNPATGTNPAYSSISSPLSPAVSTLENGANAIINFGQRPFSYTPPTGYVALNTFNLADSTIKKGNKYMDATLYTGNGSTQTVTNAGSFKPDFVWVKARSATYNHTLYDSIRGVNNYLISNLTNAAASSSDTLQAFNSNGFTVGTNQGLNENASTYVGWQWQAGQGSTSSNTSGTITSTVSVNTTAGFSIVTWTGNGTNGTIGHGLGVAPKMIIAKIRSTTDNWLCYHSALGATKYINLNTQGTATTNAGAWNNTEPTSSVFSVSSTPVWLNNNGSTYVAYCWAEIAGFSKFGSYTGVSGADGAFVYTGFRPKFVMIKSSNLAGENWAIFDTSRNTYNVTYLELFPNASNAEVDGAARGAVLDLLSNGFKIRATNPELNDVAGTYIYMAFAENPTKYALAR